MFISDEHKLIVMLPQKCASSTLQIRLKSIRSPESLDTHTRYEEELGKYMSKHITLKSAFKLKAYKSRLDYRKVCFVRNPYDRVYSWFKWLENFSNNLALKAADDQTEIGRVERVKRSLDRKAQKMVEANYDFNRYLKLNKKSFKPACRFTHHRGRCHVDFIGYQECFESDYEKMIERFNLPVSSMEDGNVMNSKRSGKRPPELTTAEYQYTDLFNRESIQIINRSFKKDFKYFDYPVLDPRIFPRSLD